MSSNAISYPSKIFWFDVETTGLDEKRHGIFEFAGLLEHNGEIIDEINETISPFDGVEFEREALKKLGHTEKEIMSCDKEEIDLYKILHNTFDIRIDKFNKKDKLWIGGFNVSFDLSFLVEFWKRNCGPKEYLGSYIHYNKQIDPMHIYNVLDFLGKAKPSKNRRLKTLAKAYNINIDGKFHEAMTDIKATRDLAYRLLERR